MSVSDASFDKLIKDYQTAIAAIGDIAEAYHRLGKFNAGLSAIQAGILLAESIPEKRLADDATTKLLLQQGRLLVTKGEFANSDYDAALSALQRARDLAASAGNEDDIASALHMMGLVHYFNILHTSERLVNSGDERYHQPLDYFQQALARREARGDSRGICESFFWVGLIHERWGQFDTAQSYYTKALAIADEHGYQVEKAEPFRHQGGYALHSGDLDKALALFKASLASWEAAGYRMLLPFAHLAVGRTFLAKQEMAQAAAHYQAASAISQGMDTPINDIAVALSLGGLHQQQHELAQARSSFEEAYASAKDLALPMEMAAASKALAEIANIEGG